MSDTVRRGIPTVYAGIEFRSRLEARWAAFFDEIGWRWSYEPFDADHYIPDFLIHGERSMLVEIKPFHAYEQWAPVIERVRSAVEGHWYGDILYVGVEPAAAVEPETGWGHGALGMLDEYIGDLDGGYDENGKPWAGGAAVLGHCMTCGTRGVFHAWQSYAVRPCGHHKGSDWMWRPAWANATNAVKWAGR